MLPLLENGNCLRPIKIGKQFVSVRNTCAFDSTIQSVLTACHDFASYAEYFTKSNFYLSKFIQTITQNGVTAELYKERGHILNNTKALKDGILDCMINISYLQEKFILRDVPSLEQTIRCADCLFENTQTLPVLYINPISIYKYGMEGLQEAVNETSKINSTNICFKCKSTNITENLSEGNHIMLSVEDVGNSLLITRRGYPNCRRQFTVEEIPDKLISGKYTYKFVSAIIHNNEHYIAFIKRVTGKWEKHNDLQQRIMSVTARTLLQKYNIHILFYVRI